MEDYDTALELDSTNYIGHFNRGLLRAQVGDDNRAIEDFNFVLKLEPDNMIALFNRALMLNNTGDLQGGHTRHRCRHQRVSHILDRIPVPGRSAPQAGRHEGGRDGRVQGAEGADGQAIWREAGPEHETHPEGERPLDGGLQQAGGGRHAGERGAAI